MGFSGTILGSPVVPPGQVTVNLVAEANAPEGTTAIMLRGESGALVHDITLNLTVLGQTLEQTAGLWQNPPNFNADYDFDQNLVIEVLDLIAYFNLCLAPFLGKAPTPWNSPGPARWY